ncbi:Hypothetical predicted protein [Mytilus galloprovincialis]|uniref:B box-type domain-containing protein n=1 Tax=Mytilus galloprovincialis TaxID=29158 RepID=A0A8B6HFC0_MYTGA|nr:Hypothetical predicted protein [Mytilus galloprovincialis]
MATPPTKFCGICEQDHLNEPADIWCPECDEAYCTNCKKHHGFSKLSKHHKTIKIEDYFKLPSFLLSTKQQCHDHTSPFELYCKTHNAPCCIFCMKDTHKECLQFEPLKEIVKDIKHSSRFSILEQLLENVMSDIDFLIEHTSKNISIVDSKTNECLEKIKQKRNELNDHFDKLEKKLKEEILLQKKTTVTHVESITTELHSRKENIIKVKENIMKMKNLSTDLQTFFGLIEIEKEVSAHESYLNSLNDSESLRQTEYSLNTLVVDDLILQFKSLGQLSVDKIRFKHCLNTLKNDQAQLNVNIPSSVDKIKISLKFTEKLGLGNEYLTGCAIKPNGDFLFVNYSPGKLLTCKSDGSNVKDLVTFDTTPNDVVYIPHKDVAVISFIGSKIIFVDLLSNKQIKNINVKSYGIDFTNDRLILASCSNIIHWLDMQGDVVSDLCLKTNAFYVTATNTCVYSSDYSNKSVISSDYKGKQLWKFKHDKLFEPLGITSTLSGYIFVTDRKSKNVFLISPDGSQSKIVLSFTGAGPRAIHFNRSRNELLVTRQSGDEISLYDIQF